jgi:hypothetical protein
MIFGNQVLQKKIILTKSTKFYGLESEMDSAEYELR